MKKLLSLILSLTMVCTMCICGSVTAFAAESPVGMEISNSEQLYIDFSMNLDAGVNVSQLKIEFILDSTADITAACNYAKVESSQFGFDDITTGFQKNISTSDGKTYVVMSFPWAKTYSSGTMSAILRIYHSDNSNLNESYTAKVYLNNKEVYPQNKLNSESIISSSEDAQFNIKGTYQAGAQADTVYSVDVAWGSMEFTYTDASQGKWDPLTHEYTDAVPAGWSCDTGANKITVTNCSNAPIDAGLSYANANGFDLTAEFTDDESTVITEFSLPTAASYGETQSGPRTAAAYLNITGGTISSDTAAKTTLGTITVTISDAE